MKKLCWSILSCFGVTLLTHQIPQQRLQLEPGEVGGGGQRQTRPVGTHVVVDGQGDDAGRHGKEADEDGAQDEHDHQEDDEGRLGVDVSADQTHQQADQAEDRGVEQRPPVARRQDLVGGSDRRRFWTWRVTKGSGRKKHMKMKYVKNYPGESCFSRNFLF